MFPVLGLQLDCCKWNRPHSSVIHRRWGRGDILLGVFPWPLFQAAVKDLGVNIASPPLPVI